VIATSPITNPVEAPTKVVFPSENTSINIHETRAAAAETDVVINACAASPFAARALPALNPYHPNHNSAAPKNTNGVLCTW